MTTTAADAEAGLPARERILAAATSLFYAEGIRAASADRLLAAAGVSKMTFYRHFPTKADLVVSYLEATAAGQREQVLARREEHPGDPAAVLRWYADTVGLLSCGPGFRGCAFINAAAELSDPEHPARRVISEHREWLATQATELLTELGITDAARKAGQLIMLRDGAMVAGYVGQTPESVADYLVDAGRAVIQA